MERIVSKDGTLISFARDGSGPPLVLVHGTTADHNRWAKILPLLEKDFTTYALDRRGRGGSGDATDYAILREAEDVSAVAEVAAELDGEPVSVLGHSFGGLCSLEAARLSSKISKLILYEPPLPNIAPFFPLDVPDRMQKLIDSGMPSAALELFMREVVKMPEHELATYRQLPMWQRRIELVPTISRELSFGDGSYRFEAQAFTSLQTPTMLFLGGDSSSFASQVTEILHEVLPYSQVVVLPGQQHIAMDLDPDLFIREVRKFLLEPRI